MSTDDDFGALPPSYDDVIAAGSSVLVRGKLARPAPLGVTPPSAPTLFPQRQPGGTASTLSALSNLPPQLSTGHLDSSTGRRNVSPPSAQTHGSGTRQQPVASQPVPQRQRQPRQPPPRLSPTAAQPPRNHGGQSSLVNQIALFSMPNIMLTGLTLPQIDVDLDTEAHLPHRRKAVKKARIISRIKCACGCFWLFGFILLFLLIALPIAMILTGVFGVNDCPYNDNLLVTTVIVLGVLMAVCVLLRLILSALTCCKIADVGGSKNSYGFSLTVNILELTFLVLLTIFLILMLVATWFVFAVSPNETNKSSDDYCSSGFYTATSVFMGTNLALCVFLVVYLSCLAVFYFLFNDAMVAVTTEANSSSSSGGRRRGAGHGYIERSF